jgi:hypothetical protein
MTSAKMKYIIGTIICMMAPLLRGQAGGDYQMISSVIDNGGGISRSEDYELLGSITSDPVSPSVLNSEDYTLYGGFLGQIADLPTLGGIQVGWRATNAVEIIGSIQYDGGDTITESGVVFALASENADPLLGGLGVTKVTTPGVLGTFTSTIFVQPETNYVVKAYATNSQGTVYSPILALTTFSRNADLNELVFSFGEISPVFSKAVTSYSATVNYQTASIFLQNAAISQANAAVAYRLNGGDYVGLGGFINLNVGNNVVDVRVTAQDGVTEKIYTLNVTRQKELQSITFDAIPDKLTTDSVTLTAAGGPSGNPVTIISVAPVAVNSIKLPSI